jgi:hypothetical protein
MRFLPHGDASLALRPTEHPTAAAMLLMHRSVHVFSAAVALGRRRSGGVWQSY